MNEAKRKNILFAVIAVVIAVVFFFAGFGTGFGVGKGAADAPDADAGASFEMDGGMQLSSDEDTDKGVSLTSVKIAREAYGDYDIMPIAETAYTVTATVSGDGLTEEQKSVTWGEAAFKDPSSAWATGKNVSDYVTATPSGNQLTVQCLKAFGEQIIIKCSSSFNPDVSKDLKVDYMDKRDDQIEIDGQLLLNAKSIQFPFYISSDHDAQICINSTHSEAYTIESENVSVDVSFKLSNILQSFSSYYSGFSVPSSVTLSTKSPKGTIKDFFDRDTFQKCFVDAYSSMGKDRFNNFYNMLQSTCTSTGKGMYQVTIKWSNYSSSRICNLVPELTELNSWYNSFKSTQLDFDAPYSDGVIFNQD